MTEKFNPWLGSRSRKVSGSNGALQSVLSVAVSRGETAVLRKEISTLARATKTESAEGRSAMFTRPIPAAKALPEAFHHSATTQNPFLPSDEVMKNAAAAHGVLNTFQTGSVGRLILSLHCLGFRLYQKANLAGTFLAAEAISEYESHLKSDIVSSGLTLPELSISAVYNALSSSVRGKGEQTSIEPMLVRLFSAFTGEPLTDRETSTAEYEFCRGLAAELIDQFETWPALTGNPMDAARVIAPIFMNHGFTTDMMKALEILSSQLALDGDLKYRTLVFDRSAPQFPTDLDPATALIAIIARYASETPAAGSKLANYVKGCVTTTNANGLAWVLGKGMSHLPAARDEDLAAAIGADRSVQSVSNLIKEIKAVRKPELFVNFSLADIRSDVQGKIDSFISNHVARLESTYAALSELEPLMGEWVSSVLSHVHSIDATSAYNTHLLEQSASAAVEMKEAAHYLLGRARKPITVKAVKDSIESFNRGQAQLDYIAGATGIINGVIKRSEGTDLITVPKALEKIISLPVIGDPIIDPLSDREICKSEFANIHLELTGTIIKMTTEYSLSYEKSFLCREQFFETRLAEVGTHRAINSAHEFAYRDLFSRLCRLVYQGSAELRSLAYETIKATKLFVDNEELREHLYNRQHYVYVDPADRKAKKILRFNEVRPAIEGILQTLIDGSQGRDKTLLTMLNCNILLMGLPPEVDSSLLHKQNLRCYGDKRYIAELDQPTISRIACQALMSSAYTSRMNGLLYRLNKSEFTHTFTFKPYIVPQLFYVPKDREWKVPQQLFEGRYTEILNSDLIVWSDAGNMRVIQTAKRIAADKQMAISEKLAMLKEMPHSYAMAAGINGLGITATAIGISPAGIQKASDQSGLILISLPRNNTPAVRAIEGWMRGGKISPPALQIQCSYRETDGVLHEVADERFVFFQLPVAEVTNTQPAADLGPKHLLGIDPGEYGFGIGLTDLQGRVIDSGFIHINSLIKFMKNKRTQREVRSPRQQYKAKYSNHLEKAAKAAVGDIAHILDRLIYAFNAIPVFEALGNQSNDSDAVWERILSTYSFAENDTQNAARLSHWFGAGLWDHPGIMRKLPTDKTAKPFIGFPGTRVGAAGNSQRCHCCGKNPIESARSLLTSNGRAEIIGGRLVTPDGVIILENPDPATATERRRAGRGPEWVAVGSKTFIGSANSKEGRELLTIIRRSIRRAPEYRKTTQGIESIYVCAFDNCPSFDTKAKQNSPMNSEANAAINACQKLAEQLIFPVDSPTAVGV